MIQYYINKLIDDLTYLLKPRYEKIPDESSFSETTMNYSYGAHAQQVLDFYKGDGTTNKLFIFLHGGAWYATHRQRDYYRSQFVEPFVTAHPDISVVNADYRLLVENDMTTNVFPNQIDDVQTIMQIFSDLGYEIYLGGNSAGGHLSTWYYLNQLEPKPVADIRIVAAYDGFTQHEGDYYFKTGIPVWIQNQFVDSSLGVTTTEEMITYASPRTYFNSELDDILAIFGTADPEVPQHQMTAMQEDYPNIDYWLFTGDHNDWHTSTALRDETISRVYNFIMKERDLGLEQVDEGNYLVKETPVETKFNRLRQTNTPFKMKLEGTADVYTYQSFKGEVIQELISDYSLRKISYNFSSFNLAFNIITPETENGYTFMIIKNNTQRYLLVHKGFSSSKYTIPKGATNQDVEFLILRISNTEVLFFANTPQDWKYELYYAVPGDPLNAPHRRFTNIPSLHVFPNAAAIHEYVFRVRGEDGDGNLTEWSTDYVDGTDAFFVPRYDDETTNQYMPELEKINLTSNLFSVVFYPKFEQGLGMIGIEHNTDQEILRSTDLDRVYANTSDAVVSDVDATLEMHRFNPQSERYQNLLNQLGTQDLNVRAQLEWDAINGVEIPEVEIPVDLVLLIDTTKEGTPVGFTIPVASRLTYLYDVDWGDGITTANHIGSATHTYASDGIYEVRITGTFPKFYFNYKGDRMKLLEVRDWGALEYHPNQDYSFAGCSNLTFIATDENGWYNNITHACRMFENCQLSFLPDNMTLNSLVDGRGTFKGNLLTSLPEQMFLNSLVTAGSMGIGGASGMFWGNPLTSLPHGMTLNSLVTGSNMFRGCLLPILPDTLSLNSLVYGESMFYNNELELLPEIMTLNNLENGSSMFALNNLININSLRLENLRIGGGSNYLPSNKYIGMFTNNSITEIPAEMTLDKLENQNSHLGTNPPRFGMFYNNPITNLGGLRLDSLGKTLTSTAGHNMFSSDANIPTSQYSNLLINLDLYNPYDNVRLVMGSNTKYNTTAVTSRANLVARGWVIVDGGLE